MDIDFDFQEWASLARTDPQAFELRRRQYIDLLLNSANKHRQRLEGLQFKVDATRRLAHSPPEALLAISELMIQSLSDLRDELTALELLARGENLAAAPRDKNRPPCKVIPMLPKCGDLLESLIPV